MDSADGFLLAGFKQRKVRLLPHTAQTLTYTCMAIQTGARTLPVLRLQSAREDGVVHTIGPFTTTVL